MVQGRRSYQFENISNSYSSPTTLFPVFNEESDGNIDTEFAQHAFPNPGSEFAEVEENGNVLVEKEVTPPQKKRKNVPYRKPISGKSKQTWEDISATDMMIKKTVSDIDQVNKLFNKPEEDDSNVYFCKSLIRQLKGLPAKKNPKTDTHKNRRSFIQLIERPFLWL